MHTAEEVREVAAIAATGLSYKEIAPMLLAYADLLEAMESFDENPMSAFLSSTETPTMRNLHPELLALIEAGPQSVWDSFTKTRRNETEYECRARIAEEAVRIEREEREGFPEIVLTFCGLLVPDDSDLLNDEEWLHDALKPNSDGECSLRLVPSKHVEGMAAVKLVKQRAIRRRGKP